MMEEEETDPQYTDGLRGPTMILGVIIIIIFTCLVFYLSIQKSDCSQSCSDKGFSSGFCVSMDNSQTCESKSASLTSPLFTNSLDTCRQKQPQGYRNMCCCLK